MLSRSPFVSLSSVASALFPRRVFPFLDLNIGAAAPADYRGCFGRVKFT
jgi:hypothetical protein